MEIETYEVEDLVCSEDGTIKEREEVCQEQMELAEKLGLEGQKELSQRFDDDSGDTISLPVLCPYRKMTEEERDVYGAICEVQTSVEKYSATPIPLRVLQIIEHAKSLDFFEDIQVWHEKVDHSLKDPVLVGVHKSGSYTRQNHLLARWGEVLKPFSDLRRIAGEKQKNRRLASLKQIASEVQIEIAKADATPIESAAGLKPNPSFYA